jgi:putative salt-induced outer membrane protein YdiY
MKNLILIIVTFIMIFNNEIIAQVNTESIRKENLEKPFGVSLNFDGTLVKGNSNYSKLKTGLRIDFQKNKTYLFTVGEYHLGLKDDSRFIQKGFGHLRGIRNLHRRIGIELFCQKEFNEFISLKDRNLAGGGLRIGLLLPDSTRTIMKDISIQMGNGIMWENEVIDAIPEIETHIARSTNYLSLLWNIDKRLMLDIVVYCQFDVANFSDYRVLTQNTLTFNITKYVTFRSGFNLRYDNEPPATIEKYDLELNSGFGISF